MALRTYNPVADLKKRRKQEEAMTARLAPRKEPGYVKSAGDAFKRGNKETSASLARQHTARVKFGRDEQKRISKVKSDLYDEEAALGLKGLEVAGGLARQKMVGRQQRGAEKTRSRNAMRLAEYKSGQDFKLAGPKSLKPGRKVNAGGLSVKDRFGIRKGLLTEFNADTPAGEALREKYGPNGSGMFITQMEDRYQPQQPGLPARPQPPAQMQAFKDPATGVWGGGQVEQPSMLPSMGSAGGPGQLPVNQPVGQQYQPQQPSLAALSQPPAQREDTRLGEAFTPAPSLSEFNQARVDQREAKLAEAFGRPLRKKALPLPGKRLSSSLRGNVLRERAMREGGGAYYNR